MNDNRGNERGNRGHSSGRSNISGAFPVFNPEWIESGLNTDAIKYTESLGMILGNSLDEKQRLTTSQIRNFYGELKRIQSNLIEKNKANFLLLHPKLAYSAKRAGKEGARLFKVEVMKAHEAVRIEEEGFAQRFENFCDLCEAILAFHRAHGGN